MLIKHKKWIDKVYRTDLDNSSRYNLLRLDKNERVTPYSSNLWKTFIGKISQEHILAYPEPDRFYSKLGDFLGFSAEQIVLTAGSDAAIRNAFDLCVNPGDAVVTLQPTFAMINVYCELYNAEKRFIPFDSRLSLNLKNLLDAVDENVSLVILANPNSPTGTYIDYKDMEKIVKKAYGFGIAVLIDEAYFGFCTNTCISLVDEFTNVMITRTFSKACGLAGLRIGYIIASLDLTTLLYKFRPMYEVNSIALLFSEAILDNWNEVESYISEVKTGKDYLKKNLDKLGFKYIDTQTNFIHIDFNSSKSQVQKKLLKNGINVSQSMSISGFETFLRITLAPSHEVKRIVNILETL